MLKTIANAVHGSCSLAEAVEIAKRSLRAPNHEELMAMAQEDPDRYIDLIVYS